MSWSQNSRAVDMSGRARASRRNPLDDVTRRHQRHLLMKRQVAAAIVCQRCWRGYVGRRKVRVMIRNNFDDSQASGVLDEKTMATMRKQLEIFIDPFHAGDADRLARFISRSIEHETDLGKPLAHVQASFIKLGQRLFQLVGRFEFPGSEKRHDDRPEPGSAADVACRQLMVALESATGFAMAMPELVGAIAEDYYDMVGRQMSKVMERWTPGARPVELVSALMEAARAPLFAGRDYLELAVDSSGGNTERQFYSAFAFSFLARMRCSSDAFQPELLESFANLIDCRTLTWALEETRRQKPAEWSAKVKSARAELSADDRLSLLGFIVFLHLSSVVDEKTRVTNQTEFIAVVSDLLGLLSGPERHPALSAFRLSSFDSPRGRQQPTPEHHIFVQENLERLVTVQYVTPVFFAPVVAAVNPDRPGDMVTSAQAKNINQVLFSRLGYVNALMSCFPRRADDIRTWLYAQNCRYVDETGATMIGSLVGLLAELAIKTDLVISIAKSPHETIDLVAQMKAKTTASNPDRDQLANEWRLVVVMVEIYSFIAQIVDDDKFYAGIGKPDTGSSGDIRMLVPLDSLIPVAAFLRNLAFSLFFYASEIGDDAESDESLSLEMIEVVDGITVAAVRDSATSVLRGLNERDSRRRFVPDQFWLMSRYFNIDGFIPDIVAEEERRQINLGASIEQVRHAGRFRREVMATRIAPRLDIVERLPFLIPFHTRAAIFNEFVMIDRERAPRLSTALGAAYGGNADYTAASLINDQNPWMRPTAQIRRGFEFDDGLEQFVGHAYDFRDRFQVEFVDQFDMREAGVDGGGVTKEFLLAAIRQGMERSDEPPLFVETAGRRLFPNPTIIEELTDIADAVGRPNEPTETRNTRRRLLTTKALQQYEFLGLLVGKCMYEGILINYDFAGFFLVKWALSGIHGGSAAESGYRAGINDLREFDPSLYSSLVKLKNYDGDFGDLLVSFVADFDVPNRKDGTKRRKEVALVKTRPIPEVTSTNRYMYINLTATFRLGQQQQQQTTAFFRGLERLISPSWLAMFDRSELRTLVSGSSSGVIDLADLRRHTEYSGLYEIGDDDIEHDTIKMFWRVLENAPEKILQGLIQFVTSSPRAPLLGFSRLNPCFTIRDAGNDQDRLPSASTCVNLLKLPVYRTENALREKLYAAAESGAGFDLS